MKEIEKNRFLVWLMFLVPIAFTGWWSVMIWTMIQILLCSNQTENQKERKRIEKKEREEVIQLKEEKRQEQIELDRKIGNKFTVIDGEVYIFDRK